MFMRLSVFFGVLAIVAMVVGCGGGDSSDGSTGSSGDSTSGGSAGSGSASSGGGRTGETQCAALTCQAGQYCDNIECKNGCLSDNNCAGNQTCAGIDPQTNVGSCQNTPAGKDCDTFCQKSVACGGLPAPFCQMECDGSSSECVKCVNDSNCGMGCDAVCGK